MVYKFFNKRAAGSGIKSIPKNRHRLDLAMQQLAKELPKPIIRKLKKRKEYSSLKDNIWGGDLADMQSISKLNKRFRFLLCVIDIFSKNAWVVPVRDKKGTTIANVFQSILKNSNRKPNKIWIDKGLCQFF